MNEPQNQLTRERFKEYAQVLAEFESPTHAKLFAGLLIECGEDVAVTPGVNRPYAVRQAVQL